MREIIPTVVPTKAEDVVVALSRYSFSPTLHVDFADGVFAPNTTWLPQNKDDIPKTTTRLEAHFMVHDPLALGIICVRAGIRRLIAHIESFPHVERAGEVFALWRSAGVEEIGCAVNLQTSISVCDSYAPLVDFFQIMTIEHIGAQGQLFDERAAARMSALHTRHPKLILSADGGITLENITRLAQTGATRFCVGAALARAGDPASTYRQLQEAINEVS